MNTRKPVVDLVAGARPNFMKLAPVVRAITAADALSFRIIHTGQHYDEAMNDVFFQELGIPAPDVHLEVGSGSHGAQTAKILERYEAHVQSQRPDATVVFGDVNSTVACALAAVKLGVPVAHVEAGLRSFDRTMPEEINRILTDAIAGLLLVSEESGVRNLRAEGVADQRVRLVGNVMIDTLQSWLPVARSRQAAAKLQLKPRSYGFVTLHRPSNVDDPDRLRGILQSLDQASQRLPLVFALHPRTRQNIVSFGLAGLIDGARLLLLPPQGYLEMLGLMRGARVVLTDSGGIQEETTALGVPCITLRDGTERPVTVDQGTNTIAGRDARRILAIYEQLMAGGGKAGRVPLYWDGQAATRIASATLSWLQDGRP
jgi:UDP-N-acetylglucosamine 2-epimerase (non-hydrolysing)